MRVHLNPFVLGTGLAILALIVLSAGLLFLGPAALPMFGNSVDRAGASQQPQKEFPSFVYNSAQSLQAYKLAMSEPESLSFMPCYCDCGRASGHKNLRDCYFKVDGTLNDHASNCDVCQDEVVDLRRWQAEGKSIREIRALIDAKYREYGQPTDTPLP